MVGTPYFHCWGLHTSTAGGSILPLLGAWVQSRVGEGRSCMLCSVAKKWLKLKIKEYTVTPLSPCGNLADRVPPAKAEGGLLLPGKKCRIALFPYSGHFSVHIYFTLTLVYACELPEWIFDVDQEQSRLSSNSDLCLSQSCLQCRRPRFDSWVRKIPWRRKWQPTPVSLPRESHGQRSLAGYSPGGCKSWTRLSN